MAKEEERQLLTPNQWILLLGIALAVVFAVAYTGRVVTLLGVRAEEQQWQKAVQAEKARNAELREMLAFVRSDAYVEQVAREELGWVLPGDTVLNLEVVEPPLEEPVAQRTSPRGVSQPHWQEWWELFFPDD